MKYCLLSISYMLMMLCSNQLTAQQKIEPKTQRSATKPKRTTAIDKHKATHFDGFFFDDTPLKKALQQTSKWYKVKVNYKNIPDVKLSGTLMKNLRLSEAIEGLNIMSGAKLTLKDGTIINQQ